MRLPWVSWPTMFEASVEKSEGVNAKLLARIGLAISDHRSRSAYLVVTTQKHSAHLPHGLLGRSMAPELPAIEPQDRPAKLDCFVLLFIVRCHVLLRLMAVSKTIDLDADLQFRPGEVDWPGLAEAETTRICSPSGACATIVTLRPRTASIVTEWSMPS